MIRINLMKTVAVATTVDDTAVEGAEALDINSLNKKAAVHIMAMLSIPALMYVWELNTLPALNQEISALQQALNELTEQTSKGQAARDEIKKYQEDQSRLQAQLNSIDELKRDRLREVHLMDMLQKSIPDKLWLEKVDLNENKLSLQGIAGSENDLTAFMDALSRSSYLREVNLIRSVDYGTSVGVFKRFDVLCMTER